MARRAVLQGLWAQLEPGLPRQFSMAAALRLSVASSVPPRPLQEILGRLPLDSALSRLSRLTLRFLECPAANPQAFQKQLSSHLPLGGFRMALAWLSKLRSLAIQVGETARIRSTR